MAGKDTRCTLRFIMAGISAETMLGGSGKHSPRR